MALRTSPYGSVRRVRCHLAGGVARLEGRLPTFHLKQAAQEAVRRVEGVKSVDNRIIVDA
jgi:osmotically-inducible protein OsmY